MIRYIFFSIIIGVNFLLLPNQVFPQLGNSNGQFDDAIKQAYELLQNVSEGQKRVIKSKFIESNFQSKREFAKMLNASNISWAKEVIKANGVPNVNDIMLSNWKTHSNNEQSSTTSVNITFYFKGKNIKYANSDDHICFNFFKNSKNEYIFNGIMFFKKSELLTVKKMNDESK